MNTETETNTQQNATKPVKGKKEKKEKKEKNEKTELKQDVVSSSASEPVSEPISETVKVSEIVLETKPEQELEQEQEQEQELEVSSQEGENTELYFIKLQTAIETLTELSNSSIDDITYDKEHALKLSESSIKINKLATQFLTNVLKKQCKTNIISLKIIKI